MRRDVPDLQLTAPGEERGKEWGMSKGEGRKEETADLTKNRIQKKKNVHYK